QSLVQTSTLSNATSFDKTSSRLSIKQERYNPKRQIVCTSAKTGWKENLTRRKWVSGMLRRSGI
ncbi:hypothetical protein N0V94_009439, partial [Neodidymelliopsis sp. IMI 364377]